MADAAILHLSPLWCRRQPLAALPGPAARIALRTLLVATAGGVRIEGARSIEAQTDPVIFALTHHNCYESLVAPAALVALRKGRRIRFLVDWMFLDLPVAGWLIRQLDPIAIYRKPARFRWRESRRLAALAGPSATERALAALGAGVSIGIYPEGRRNGDPFHLAPGRRGLGLLALRSGVQVVPVGIDFPARDRLRRTPRIGRLVLRVGEALDFSGLHQEWKASGPPDSIERRQVEREHAPAILGEVQGRLARLARKIHLREESSAMSVATPARASAPSASACAPSSAGRVTAVKVDSPELRAAALGVVALVYGDEKGWIADPEAEIPETSLDSIHSSWFLARVDGEPAGAVRLAFDPALDLPRELGVELDSGVDLERLQKAGRFVEVGRLMIAPRHRSRAAVVLALMRACLAEVVKRGYTHLLTVVFEDDPHSPYRFHTRVLGFERIGTHRHGELACASRRIILVLDIARAHLQMKRSRLRLLRSLTAGIEDRLSALDPV